MYIVHKCVLDCNFSSLSEFEHKEIRQKRTMFRNAIEERTGQRCICIFPVTRPAATVSTFQTFSISNQPLATRLQIKTKSTFETFHFLGNFSHLEEIYQLRMVLICKKIIGKLIPSICPKGHVWLVLLFLVELC